MEKNNYTMNIEGLTIDLEMAVNNEENQAKRLSAYAFSQVRQKTKMNRKEFAEWLGIPYRTMQDWELGNSQVPDYVLRLVAYKVQSEKEKGNI
jgi:DNA-binding transcriptional regulator YiaG